MPGPAPKEGARNPNNGRINGFEANAQKLPAAGRKGAAPKWPLNDKPSADELHAWKAMWLTPQAVAWERLGWLRPVARYARCLVASEQHGASGALLAEVRQLEDRLGLSPMSMLRLRWTIVDEVPAEVAPTASKATRDRLRVVS